MTFHDHAEKRCAPLEGHLPTFDPGIEPVEELLMLHMREVRRLDSGA
jgi:hypothetical protein